MKYLFVAIGLVMTVLGTGVFQAAPAYAACNTASNVLGITTWYRGLPMDDNCSPVAPSKSDPAAFRKFILTIALNILQAGLGIVAYVTIFYIIKGGFLYITSAGAQDGMVKAKKTITNAVIGLIIAVFSASIVNAIAGIIK